MPLRPKIVLILIAVIGIYAAATDRVQRRIFFQRFQDVEEHEALEDMQRVVEALHAEIDEVDELSLRWSAWDDAFAFMTGERVDAFARSNLNRENLQRHGIDLLFFLAPDDGGDYEVRWSTSVDPETGEDVRLRDFPSDRIHRSHPLLVKGEWEQDRSEQEERFLAGLDEAARRERQRRLAQTRRPVGILLTEHAPLLVSARPIVDSRRGAEPAGVLVLGRFLGEGLEAELAAKTRVTFRAWQADGRHELPADVEGILNRITSSATGVIREEGPDVLHVWGTFPDYRNRPELVLRAEVGRDISAAGVTAVKFGFISALAAGFVLLLALTMLLQKIVLAPISALTAHAVRIGRKEDFRAKMGMDRGDEIGTLSREFDGMMTKLEHARAALVETARTAGMSEIATGILHNVGNVLNSVNVSASMVAQKVDRMCIGDLQRVVEVLEGHKDDLAAFIGDDPKGKHLQPFLSALCAKLGEEQQRIASEVGSLTQGIDHICDLIKSQQSFAIQAELVEEIGLADKMDEALRITEQAIAVDPNLRVVREYDDLPEVLADKHRLLEVLVNLIQNARQAMDGTGREKRLTLRLRRAGEDRVRLSVSDTGVGIDRDSLTKVFALGYTTRPGGHGYGLHTAANAATEMGGSLTADSSGPGTGATFTLELPFDVAANAGVE